MKRGDLFNLTPAKLTRKERGILAEAAAIIVRELTAKREIRIPGFGKFYLSSLQTPVDHPMDEDASFYISHVVTLARFKPWKALRDAVKNRQSICNPKVPGKHGGFNTKTCYHPDGAGHEGPHVDYRGRRWELDGEGGTKLV